MTQPITAGHTTSEHARAKRAQIAGEALLALGVLGSSLGAYFDRLLLTSSAAALALAGSIVIIGAVSGYAKSRAIVKAPVAGSSAIVAGAFYDSTTAPTFTANVTAAANVGFAAGLGNYRLFSAALTSPSGGGDVTVGASAPTAGVAVAALEILNDGAPPPSGPANSGMMGWWGMLLVPSDEAQG